jgi:hypothetical protein
MNGSMKDAKKIFYKTLDGKLTKKEALENLLKISNKKIMKGYYFGVKGLLIKQKDTMYSFKPDGLKRYEIIQLIKKLEAITASKFTNEFDKGYFYAWIDYLRFITGNSSKKNK